MSQPPEGYLGAEARIRHGPAPELVEAGYRLEVADAPLLHRGLTLADLAHLAGLAEARIVPPPAAAQLATTLLALLDTAAADVGYDARYGDAYNSRERRLEKQLGTTAGWLHTGRTRREAGRTAFRLALRERLEALHEAVTRYLAALLDRASEHAATLWNDTTYLQPAQPSAFGHYLLGFAEEAARHLGRIEAAHRWADTSPAGVGGVGGTRIPLDRGRLAELLGFSVIGSHTRDVMWATDGLVDAVAAAAQAATSVDRLAEDLEVFTSPQFGYVTLAASLCRASVQMPQKRNPYALAVVRGGASTLLGRVAGALASQRTPSARTDNWLYAYGEVAGSLVLARRVVALGAAVVETLEVDVARLRASAGSHFSGATDVADALVLAAGLDYRSAYRLVGRAVSAAIDQGRETLDPAALAAAAATGASVDGVAAAVAEALDPEAAVAARTAEGGSAPERVRERVAELLERVAAARAWVAQRREAAQEAEAALVHAARGLTGSRGDP